MGDEKRGHRTVSYDVSFQDRWITWEQRIRWELVWQLMWSLWLCNLLELCVEKSGSVELMKWKNTAASNARYARRVVQISTEDKQLAFFTVYHVYPSPAILSCWILLSRWPGFRCPSRRRRASLSFDGNHWHLQNNMEDWGIIKSIWSKSASWW